MLKKLPTGNFPRAAKLSWDPSRRGGKRRLSNGYGLAAALQRALGTPVDGVVSEGSAMVMALQQRLNEGRF